MLTTNNISAALFLLNFILSAIYLGAGQGFLIFLFSLGSAFIVRNSAMLSAHKEKPSNDSSLFQFGRHSNKAFRRIDETSPPGCVSALAWLFLISTSIYTLILIWPEL